MAASFSVSEGLALRYAKALFELAEEARSLDRVADDLRAIRTLMAETPDLVRLVRSPLIGRDAQARAMDAVLDKAGMSDLVRRFVGVVAANRRLFALDRMAESFLAELARRRGEVTAQVVSAHPLSDAQTAKLSDALKKAMGAKVDVALSVDPSLLGGMVVRIGSRMIDSSLKTKLDRLQLAMKGIG